MIEKYFIYEIPGVKVGVTKNLSQRQERQKNKGRLNVLETHSCVFKASERELELQKQKGYRVDSRPYYKQLEIQSLSNLPAVNEKRSKTAKSNEKWHEGLKHFHEYNEKNKKPIIGIKNGKKYMFDSVSEASKTLEVTNAAIINAIKRNGTSAGYKLYYNFNT